MNGISCGVCRLTLPPGVGGKFEVTCSKPGCPLTTKGKMMSMLDNLGYEQLRALAILGKTPDLSGTDLCSRADCSWDEMFTMAERGLLDIGEERLAPNQLHPTLTDLGRETLKQALEKLPSLAGEGK
jgi:hypothetical protein